MHQILIKNLCLPEDEYNLICKKCDLGDFETVHDYIRFVVAKDLAWLKVKVKEPEPILINSSSTAQIPV